MPRKQKPTDRGSQRIQAEQNLAQRNNMLDLNAKVHLLRNLAKRDHRHEGFLRATIAQGVGKYLKIKELYREVPDVAQCEALRTTFHDFYGLGPTTGDRGSVDEDAIWDLISRGRQKDAPDNLDCVIKKISKQNHQLSFSTKVRHTVNNNLAIYDSIVSTFLEIEDDKSSVDNCVATFQRLDNVLNENRALFDDLTATFNYIFLELKKSEKNEIMERLNSCGLNHQYNTDEIHNLISGISRSKKIDFMIWGYGSFVNELLKKTNPVIDDLLNDENLNKSITDSFQTFFNSNPESTEQTKVIAVFFKRLIQSGKDYIFPILNNVNAEPARTRALAVLREIQNHSKARIKNKVSQILNQLNNDNAGNR